MTAFNRFLEKQGPPPPCAAETPEEDIPLAKLISDARKSVGITQKQLSERSGIAQSDISRMENELSYPSVRTLRRLAAGMGMRLNIAFQPLDE
ncbi:MAG: helix-turn-helix transcriptional regulator [Desulfovibrionaceae bacterium]|nr:helix-turn-helix transcriptional regulator [Desulfovibrionaceae bacterium]